MITWIIAIAMGMAIMAVSLWAIRLLATPQPPEPDPLGGLYGEFLESEVFPFVENLGRLGVRRILIYTILGIFVWFAFHESGVPIKEFPEEDLNQ